MHAKKAVDTLTGSSLDSPRAPLVDSVNALWLEWVMWALLDAWTCTLRVNAGYWLERGSAATDALKSLYEVTLTRYTAITHHLPETKRKVLSSTLS